MESPTSFLAAAALAAEREVPQHHAVPRRSRPRRPHIAVIAVLTVLALAVFASVAAAQEPTIRLLSDGPFPTDPELPAAFAQEAGGQVFFQTEEQLAGTDTDATIDAYARAANGSLTHLTDTPKRP